jgi:hypothetical protein
LQRLYSIIESPPEPFDQPVNDLYEPEAEQEMTSSNSSKMDELLPRLARVQVDEPPPSASVFKLFGYFSDAWVQSLAMPYDDVRETVQSRCTGCATIQKEVVERRAQLERTIHTFVTSLVLELFTVDARGAKIRQIDAELEETYLLGDPPRRPASSGNKNNGAASTPRRDVIRGGKANFINVDAVNRSAQKTYRESMSTKDEFFKKCSDAKKRGRRPTADRNQQIDRVDLIKSGHILSQKSVAPITYSEADDKFYTMANTLCDSLATSADVTPSTKQPQQPQGYGIQSTVDFYPVFMKVLQNFYHRIPSCDNHGIYLQTLNRAVRKLSPQQWPALGLIKSLINMERCFPLSKVTVPRKGTYHCAYSGLALKPGEQVWHLRLLVNDGGRYLKWTTADEMPPVPMTVPEFTRSIRAYFIKCAVLSQRSLFYTEPPAPSMSPVLATPSKSLSAGKPGIGRNQRILCVNTMWLLLNQLRVFITQEELSHSIYGQKQRQLSYSVLMKQMTDLYSAPVTGGSEVATQTLNGYLFIGTLVNDFSSVDVSRLVQNPQAISYIDMVRDALLDFIDMMFPFPTSTIATIGSDQLMRRTFSMNKFGIRNDEKTKIPAIIMPVPAESPIFGILLALSDARALRDPGYMERKERLERLEALLARHPYVFMALFQVLYQPHSLQPQHKLSFRDVNRYLRVMGLYVNTDPSLIL